MESEGKKTLKGWVDTVFSHRFCYRAEKEWEPGAHQQSWNPPVPGILPVVISMEGTQSIRFLLVRFARVGAKIELLHAVDQRLPAEVEILSGPRLIPLELA